MGKKRNPYIRPKELGSNDLPYTVRVVQDGTRTVAEVYEGERDEIGEWSKPIGVGHAVRRKGDRRDNSLGVTLALGRAFQCAADNAFEAAEKALND